MPNAKRFEHYEVLEREDGSLWELGRGAMGVTYKATDTDLHCTVALKVISPAILNTEGTAQRFLREARAAAQLRHPNIATVLRLGKTKGGTHFYAMEFCEGNTLEQLVANEGPLRVELALEFTLQVAKALVAAEEHQVVHRDIKPSNLIIGQRRDEGPVVKVIDFGLAKSVAGAGNAWSSMTLATAGFIGTAHFSSPEQLEEGEVDVRSDIYSLGVTLWFMLTGEPMFSGSVPRVMSQHLSSPPPWEQLDPLGVPEIVRQLLATMLAKEAKDRPPSAIELKQKIQLCLQGGRDDTKEPSDPVIAQRADSDNVINKRWSLLEEPGAVVVGRLYRALDLTEKDRVVAVRFLHPQLYGNKTSWAQLERAAQLLKGAPDSVVHPIQLDHDHKHRPFLVTEWVNGMPLSTLLRGRGSLTLKEILHLLKDLAAAFDYAVERQIECSPFSKDRVMLSLPVKAPIEEQFAALIQKPMTDWPAVRGMIDLLPVHKNSASAGETISSMQTILPGAATDSDWRVPRLQSLGLLVYELLGGTAKSDDRYVPVARLSAEGNDLLKRNLDGAQQAESTFTGALFLDRLTKSAGFEPAWKPPVTQTEPRIHPLPHRRYETPSGRLPTIIRAHPALWAIGAIVLTIGLLGLILGHSDQEAGPKPSSPVVDSPKVTPAEITAPVAPPSAVPRVKLLGTLLSTQYSPQGDVRVEHRSGGYIYLIALSDETNPFLFQTSASPKDEVLFSGDEKWLVLNKDPHGAGGSSHLYYRVRSDNIEYAQPPNWRARESFTDALWHFYLREVGLSSIASRYETGVMGLEWRPDSNAFRFRIDSFGPNGRKVVPTRYECDYQVNAERFNSVTDTTVVRGALASANALQPSASVTAATPDASSRQTPGSTPPPIVFVPTQAPTPAPVPTPVSTSSPAVTNPPGRYPETGTRVFTASELQNWPPDQLQYAINEIFARHGAMFPDQKVQKQFKQFAWYHPKPNLTFDQIEQSLQETERQNLQLFGLVRDSKKSGGGDMPVTKLEPTQTPKESLKLFSGIWIGKGHSGAVVEGVNHKGSDISLTIEIDDSESSISLRDNLSPRHSQYSVSRNGRSLSWNATRTQDTTAGPEPVQVSGTFDVLPNGTVAHYNESEKMHLQGRGLVQAVEWGTFEKVSSLKTGH